jgi:hypothetical protein
MNKAKQVLILAIIAMIVIASGLIMIDRFGDSPVQASQSVRSGIQKWEYCAITNFDYSGGDFGSRGTAVVRYFQAGGGKDETVESVSDSGKSMAKAGGDALAKAIAKLGDEGWEMVSKELDTGGKFKPFYFKRPKQ